MKQHKKNLCLLIKEDSEEEIEDNIVEEKELEEKELEEKENQEESSDIAVVIIFEGTSDENRRVESTLNSESIIFMVYSFL